MKRHLLSSTSPFGLSTARSVPEWLRRYEELHRSDPLLLVNDDTFPDLTTMHIDTYNLLIEGTPMLPIRKTP